jgi:hypothetical protein
MHWQIYLVHPFGARRIPKIDPLLRILMREPYQMVRLAPMAGARC